MESNLKTLLISIILLSSPLFSAPQTAPKPRSETEIKAVLAKAPETDTQNLRPINIILVADTRGGYKDGEHCHPLWQKRWLILFGGEEQARNIEKQLNLHGKPAKYSQDTFKGAANVTVTTAWVWPTKKQLETADLIVKYAYGNWNAEMINDLKTYLSQGGGFVAIHPVVVTPKDQKPEEIAELLGLAFEWKYSRYRHGPLELKIAAKNHPICLGLPEKMDFIDEPYWPLRGNKSKTNILAVSDEKITEDSNETQSQPMFWTYEYGKGRVFGCILGHYDWTFDDPYFRILLLRGMAWSAGESVYRFDPLVLRGIPLSD